MSKKLRCTVTDTDWIWCCKECCGDVAIMVCIDNKKEHIFLTPTDARKLRKQIKKALEAIEGVDEDETVEKPKTKPRFPDWFQSGAIVEITGNSNNHQFKIGEKVRVGDEELGSGVANRCDYLDGHDYWYVCPSDCKPA